MASSKKSPPLGQYTVYIARDENKNVIYVGMTNNFLRRRAEHANRFMIENTDRTLLNMMQEL